MSKFKVGQTVYFYRITKDKVAQIKKRKVFKIIENYLGKHGAYLELRLGSNTWGMAHKESEVYEKQDDAKVALINKLDMMIRELEIVKENITYE